MSKIEIHYPRWMSIPMVLFVIIFGIVWINLALKSNNLLFAALGAIIILLALVYGIYMVIAGKAPFFLQSTKK